jgi:hypothetical protein
MNATQGFAIAATFAAVAVATASTAWANQTMSGHYIETETTTTGQTTTTDWNFTPCGDGCANLSIGGRTGQVWLVNGQWTGDLIGMVVCGDGTKVLNASSNHYTWDPNTLAGTNQVTETRATCGDSAPRSYTNTIQLSRQFTTPAPPTATSHQKADSYSRPEGSRPTAQ